MNQPQRTGTLKSTELLTTGLLLLLSLARRLWRSMSGTKMVYSRSSAPATAIIGNTGLGCISEEGDQVS